MSNTQQNHGCRLTISSDTTLSGPDSSSSENSTSILTLSTAEKSNDGKPNTEGFKKKKKTEEEIRRWKTEKKIENFKIEEKENREHRTEKKTTEQHQNLTIRSGTTYNNK